MTTRTNTRRPRHSHAHQRPAAIANAPAPVPDYSRQMALKEVGPQGQGKLRASRVLVVGCGGLGVPVISYLAGAGVGRLGLVDGDRLEASNLHRQTMYALADVGKLKAELATARVRALNPDVDVRTHPVRLDATTAPEMIGQYDLVIDCTDNFSTKFLLNDVCVQKRVPVIFSSVYQYEGQIQVVRPDKDGACLRCVWPEATRDGIVGNCAEAGVLGPVPGTFGSLQAFEALKLLLDLPGQLGRRGVGIGPAHDVELAGASETRSRASRPCANIAGARTNANAGTTRHPSKSTSHRSRRRAPPASRSSTSASRRRSRRSRRQLATRGTSPWRSFCTEARRSRRTGRRC